LAFFELARLRLGAEVAVAGSGLEGVEQASSAEPAFDAVLMDIQMPEMDGYEATRLLLARMPSQTVIAMTANAMQSDREACAAAGMRDHIAKPIELETMIAVILRHCGQQSATGAPAARERTQDADDADGPIDLSAALRRMGGRRELYARVARRFEQEAGALVADARRFLRESAQESAILPIHTLKGLAGTVGMRAIGAQAAELEQRLREDAASVDAGGELATLERLVEEGRAALSALLASPSFASSAPVAADVPLDETALGEALEELDEMLRKTNMRAVQVFADLEREFGAALGERLEPLRSAMQRLDFKAAGDAARKLRGELA